MLTVCSGVFEFGNLNVRVLILRLIFAIIKVELMQIYAP